MKLVLRERWKWNSFLKRHFSCLFKKSENGRRDPQGHALIEFQNYFKQIDIRFCEKHYI